MSTDLSTLAGCEAVIERGLHTFVEVGDLGPTDNGEE